MPPALLHRQTRLGAVKRLDLALLVDAEHHGMRRRTDIEPDDVVQLLGEGGIVGELEGRHRCGARPWAFQIFCTVATASPTALAMARAVQCVASCGGAFSVIATTVEVLSSATGGLPVDLGAPDVLLWRVAIRNHRIEPTPVNFVEGDRYSIAHAQDSHMSAPSGIPLGLIRFGQSTSSANFLTK